MRILPEFMEMNGWMDFNDENVLYYIASVKGGNQLGKGEGVSNHHVWDLRAETRYVSRKSQDSQKGSSGFPRYLQNTVGGPTDSIETLAKEKDLLTSSGICKLFKVPKSLLYNWPLNRLGLLQIMPSPLMIVPQVQMPVHLVVTTCSTGCELSWSSLDWQLTCSWTCKCPWGFGLIFDYKRAEERSELVGWRGWWERWMHCPFSFTIIFNLSMRISDIDR